MTEAEALDEAAKAAGWADWDEISREDLPATHQGIRAHATTIMENAALKAENERLTAILSEMNDTDIVARTMANLAIARGALSLLDAVELTIPADRIRDDDHVIITYKTFRALRTALERIDHD